MNRLLNEIFKKNKVNIKDMTIDKPPDLTVGFKCILRASGSSIIPNLSPTFLA